MSEVSVTVSYRERIALTPGAVLTVSLDRFRGDEHTNISETVTHLEGWQVPVTVDLNYNHDAVREGDRYGVRARIANGRTILFETDAHKMIETGKAAAIELTLVKAMPMDMPSVQGVTWSLLSINGRPVAGGLKPPHIILNENGHDFGGNTGVNVFGGIYEWEAPSVMLDPQVSTMMAGSEEAMALEREFMGTLQKATRLAVEEGELVLYRGSREIMRFRKGT